MALIKCHECSGQVSDHARTCPHCGAPVIATIKRRQKAVLIQIAISIVLALVVGVFAWFAVHRIFNQILAPLKATQQSHPQ
jgi:predicted nucleic acid-binding Zn ribbon protein